MKCVHRGQRGHRGPLDEKTRSEFWIEFVGSAGQKLPDIVAAREVWQCQQNTSPGQYDADGGLKTSLPATVCRLINSMSRIAGSSTVYRIPHCELMRRRPNRDAAATGDRLQFGCHFDSNTEPWDPPPRRRHALHSKQRLAKTCSISFNGFILHARAQSSSSATSTR